MIEYISSTTDGKHYTWESPALGVKMKRLSPNAVIPTYAREGDAGLDLVAVDRRFDMLHNYVEYDTQLAVEIPRGCVGLVFPRSSVSKMDLVLANGVGVIDSGYRGSIKIRFKTINGASSERVYNEGDKVAQLVIVPIPNVIVDEVDELSESERGDGGFGSTGA